MMDIEFNADMESFLQTVYDDPKALKWLAKFKPETVEPFLASYCLFRTCWISYGDLHLHRKQEFLTAHLDEAEETLYLIQHKKLFDMQVRWCAEELQMPNVKHSMDFMALGHEIERCDFLPPITAEEFAILKKWLEEGNYSKPLEMTNRWHNYAQFLADHSKGEANAFPAFYTYFDSQMGREPLWKTLSNVRGQKEYQYLKAAAKKDPQTVDQDGVELPSLMGNQAYFGEFAQLIEDRHLNECRVAMESATEFADRRLSNAWNLLKESNEKLPIEAGEDWREALIAVADRLRRSRLVAAIDVAWENYQFRQQAGIGYSPKEKNIFQKSELDLVAAYGEEILEGRQILGEPRDFQF